MMYPSCRRTVDIILKCHESQVPPVSMPLEAWPVFNFLSSFYHVSFEASRWEPVPAKGYQIEHLRRQSPSPSKASRRLAPSLFGAAFENATTPRRLSLLRPWHHWLVLRPLPLRIQLLPVPKPRSIHPWQRSHWCSIGATRARLSSQHLTPALVSSSVRKFDDHRRQLSSPPPTASPARPSGSPPAGTAPRAPGTTA